MLIKLGKYMGRMGKSFQNLPSNCNRKKVLLFSKECQMQLKTNKDHKKSQTVSKTEASAKPFKSGLVMIHTIKFTPCGFHAEIKLDEPRTFLPIEAFVAWLLGRTFEKVILTITIITIITVIINIIITILIILHT